MGRTRENIFGYIPSGQIEAFYNISYRCGYKDFTGIFSLYMDEQSKKNIKIDIVTFNSFRKFCLKYREAKRQNDDRVKEFIKVSKKIEDIFKEIDIAIYNAAVIDTKLQVQTGLTPESYNSYLPPGTKELTKKAQINKYINHLKSEVKNHIYSIEYQPKGVESLYFVKNFETTQEALKYVRIRTIDGFMIEGTDKYFENIAHKGVAEATSPFMSYYLYYKFPLIFDNDVVLF
ncbi:MAG: hypothetical protein M0Q88_02945 [Bacilli bacterium]|nr:hypothetical protein [Bacilli bacterium]